MFTRIFWTYAGSSVLDSEPGAKQSDLVKDSAIFFRTEFGIEPCRITIDSARYHRYRAIYLSSGTGQQALGLSGLRSLGCHDLLVIWLSNLLLHTLVEWSFQVIMSAINILKFPVSSPADISPLHELQRAGYDASQILAVIGKSEGLCIKITNCIAYTTRQWLRQ